MHAAYVPLGALGITLFTLDFYFVSTHHYVDMQILNLSQFLQSFSNWRIMIDLMLIAICGGLYLVPLYAILQHRSPKEHRAQVIASNNVFNALFMVVAALVTMILLKLGFSVTKVFFSACFSQFIGNNLYL